jgi:hypothetical protein
MGMHRVNGQASTFVGVPVPDVAEGGAGYLVELRPVGASVATPALPAGPACTTAAARSTAACSTAAGPARSAKPVGHADVVRKGAQAGPDPGALIVAGAGRGGRQAADASANVASRAVAVREARAADPQERRLGARRREQADEHRRTDDVRGLEHRRRLSHRACMPVESEDIAVAADSFPRLRPVGARVAAPALPAGPAEALPAACPTDA